MFFIFFVPLTVFIDKISRYPICFSFSVRSKAEIQATQGRLPGVTCLNSFPKKPWFLRVCSTILLKTLWEKKKLLVMSNFSFSHSVFYPLQELLFPFLSKLKMLSANCFSLEESKICRMGGKGLTLSQIIGIDKNIIILEQKLILSKTLSAIYTHFNTLKKKALGKHCGKR